MSCLLDANVFIQAVISSHHTCFSTSCGMHWTRSTSASNAGPTFSMSIPLPADIVYATRKTRRSFIMSRYISTAEPEQPVDLSETHRELKAIEQKINEAKDRHNRFLQELGLDSLP